jgi:hypothetical protein
MALRVNFADDRADLPSRRRRSFGRQAPLRAPLLLTSDTSRDTLVSDTYN